MALKEAAQPGFKEYIQQVKANARELAQTLMDLGYKIVTDGTDNHIVLWDARSTEVTGSKLEKLLEKCEISVNKNSVYGDTSAVNPGGVRLGTPAMTTRGMKEGDMRAVAALIHRATLLAQRVQLDYLRSCEKESAVGSNNKKVIMKLVDFVAALDGPYATDIALIRADVEKLARAFPLPGINPSSSSSAV